jgi:hypothetical protein
MATPTYRKKGRLGSPVNSDSQSELVNVGAIEENQIKKIKTKTKSNKAKKQATFEDPSVEKSKEEV